MPNKILFISHYAGRTGAPIILLQLLQWLSKKTDFSFEVLLKKNGELRKDFASIAATHLYETTGDSQYPFVLKFFQNIAARIPNSKPNLSKRFRSSSFNLIYANTITVGDILEELSPLRLPVICHVHEMEYWIHRSGKDNFNKIKRHTHQYIAVSNAVKDNLVYTHGIDPNIIHTIHGFLPHHPSTPPKTESIRQSLQIPSDAFVVGASGAEIWRKGKDLFVQLIIQTIRKAGNLPVYFLWIGGSETGVQQYELLHDIKKMDLADRVHFIPHVANPLDYYREFDVFAMVSREDPFPLVNLEAASLGKPIVCFDKAGGTPEFVEDDAGFVVPYLDIDAMANKIIKLSQDCELRKKLGKRASEKVKERHNISHSASRIVSLINQFMT